MKNTFRFAFMLVAMSTLFVDNTRAQNNAPLKGVKDEVAQMLYDGSVENYKTEDLYTAGAWSSVRDKDVLWKKRAWRTIDVTVAANFNLTKPALGKTLGEILISGIKSGAYKAYTGSNDRFVTQITASDLEAMLQQSPDGKAMIDPSKITRFQIKEDWLYLVNEQKLVARIIGIAPVIAVTNEKGETSEQPAFWIYYPNARPQFREQKIAGSFGKSFDNLDQLFEKREFKSQVNRVTASVYGSGSY